MNTFEFWQTKKSDIELVRELDSPPPTIAFYRKLYDDRDHPAVLAEIERRGLDCEAVRKRIRALVAELRKIPHFELVMLSVGEDDEEELALLAAELLMGRFD